MTEVPADHERSGADVADAIGEAERGAAMPDTHTHPEQTKSREAPVELAEDDPAMTRSPDPES
jgi:hypothetical protein